MGYGPQMPGGGAPGQFGFPPGQAMPFGGMPPYQAGQPNPQGFMPQMQGPGGPWGGPMAGPMGPGGPVGQMPPIGPQGFRGGPAPAYGGMQMPPQGFGGPVGGPMPGAFATPARPSAPNSVADDDDFGDFSATPTPMPRAPPPTPAGPVPHGVTKDHALDDDLFAVSSLGPGFSSALRARSPPPPAPVEAAHQRDSATKPTPAERDFSPSLTGPFQQAGAPRERACRTHAACSWLSARPGSGGRPLPSGPRHALSRGTSRRAARRAIGHAAAPWDVPGAAAPALPGDAGDRKSVV